MALPGADVWRHAWGDSAHCPCAARNAAETVKRPLFSKSRCAFLYYASTSYLENAPPVRKITKKTEKQQKSRNKSP
jgi:hypothetical protein